MLLSTEQPMLTQPPTIIAGQTVLPACVSPFFCAVGNITTCCSLLWFLPDPSPLVCSARFLSCNISRERVFYAEGLHCSYVLSLLCGTFCSPQHRDAGLPPLLWRSLMFVSRDSDIRTVQIHNNYLITVIPHTRILAACPRYKKCPSQTPSSRNLQSCHFTRHSTGAEHILSLISIGALCKMLGCFLVFLVFSPCICVIIRTETAGLLLTGRSRDITGTAKRELCTGQWVSVWSQGKRSKRGQTAWNGRATDAAAPFVCSSRVQLFINTLMEFCLLLLLCLSSLSGAF